MDQLMADAVKHFNSVFQSCACKKKCDALCCRTVIILSTINVILNKVCPVLTHTNILCYSRGIHVL